MNKLVVLSLGNGNLYSGFDAVTTELWEDGVPYPMKFTGRLPPLPELPELYRHWQLLYWAVYQRLNCCSRLEIETANVTHVSEVEFCDLCRRLSSTINAWLNSEPFRHIDQQLRTHLDCSHEIRVLIETNDNLLRRLPWHLWQFFEDYPKAEVALSAPEYKRPQKSLPKTPSERVKILAIFGNSKGIDLQKDRAFLEQLSTQAETEFLVDPSLEQLDDQLWKQGWDILFFAGHSSSQKQGILQLNQTTSLTLDQLKYALKKAIRCGLKLAIFNSCDGLGLAQALFDLHIPQVIVMREPVADLVAQEFLKHFLWSFASGQSLYAAVREARERLQKLESDYPCASWLPVICQNPAEEPTTWSQWRGQFSEKRSPAMGKCSLRTVMLASVVVTALVMGVRQLGMLQAWELQAFDSLVRLRPDEGADPRLLVVTVTEQDVQNQNSQERQSASLSDRALAALLSKIQLYQPQVIGLDIYRDFPIEPKYADLRTYMQQSDRLIAVCEVGEADHSGIAPPPEIQPERLGFSDLPLDPDRVVRRQLLGMSKDERSACATDTSFSLRVAQTYLAAKGFQAQRNSLGQLQIGSAIFPQLEPNSGGYQNLDALGYQILLNYRSSDAVVTQVSLASILSNSLDTELVRLVKGRVVLIGTTAKSFKDYFDTPYSSGPWPEEMPGVFIQAQMISQILSAVLDGRPLLWWLPDWGEMIWSWSWSVVGGLLVWYFRSPLHLALAHSVALGVLYCFCFVFLLGGGWMPLVPPALVLVMTSSSVAAYALFPTRPKHEQTSGSHACL